MLNKLVFLFLVLSMVTVTMGCGKDTIFFYDPDRTVSEEVGHADDYLLYEREGDNQHAVTGHDLLHFMSCVAAEMDMQQLLPLNAHVVHTDDPETFADYLSVWYYGTSKQVVESYADYYGGFVLEVNSTHSQKLSSADYTIIVRNTPELQFWSTVAHEMLHLSRKDGRIALWDEENFNNVYTELHNDPEWAELDEVVDLCVEENIGVYD